MLVILKKLPKTTEEDLSFIQRPDVITFLKSFEDNKIRPTFHDDFNDKSDKNLLDILKSVI